MLQKKKTVDLELILRSFTHCWMKFNQSGDTNVATIGDFKFDGGKYLCLHLKKMSTCKQFVVDAFDTKKWFPIRHFSDYCLRDLNYEEMKSLVSKMKLTPNQNSLTLVMSSGDELTFTNEPAKQKEIDEILNTTL